MSKSVAGKLLEQFGKLNAKRLGEELADAGTEVGPSKDAPELDKDGKPAKKKDEDGTLNSDGEVPTAAMAKVKEDFDGDAKKTADAVGAIKTLSESKHPMAKKFMEAMNDMTSAMDIKKVDKDGKPCNEDADGEYLSVFEPQKWAHLGEKYAGMKKK
jgi:hypothetical protein